MKKVIFKYKLLIDSYQSISLPVGAEILCVQTQFEIAELWALVNIDCHENEDRHIECFGTGHEIHCDMGVERKYLGTCQFDGGNFVFHFFERIN